MITSRLNGDNAAVELERTLLNLDTMWAYEVEMIDEQLVDDLPVEPEVLAQAA